MDIVNLYFVKAFYISIAIPRVFSEFGENKNYLTIDLHFYPRTAAFINHCIIIFLLMYDFSFLRSQSWRGNVSS